MHNARLYRDLQRHNDELAARERRERLLGELSLELSSSLDLRTILDSAARRISTLLDAGGCDIYSYLEEEDALECLAACLCEISSTIRSAGTSRWGRGWLGSRHAIAEGATLAIASLDDPMLHAQERAVMREWDERSCLVAPMMARGRILGTVEVYQVGGERVFTAEEIATAEACARMTTLAVDNATLFQRQAEDARRLASLLEGGRAIALSSLVSHEVLDALVHAAAASLGCPEALITSSTTPQPTP